MAELRLTDVEPKASNWLEINLRYEGRGHADFTDPTGSVAGPSVATFDEFGNRLVETSCELISPDPDYDGPPIAFITGAHPKQEGKAKSWAIGGTENVVSNLVIEAPEGKFVSTSDVHLAGFKEGEDLRLRFYVPESKFETRNARAARYFVIPLFNCVADLGCRLFGAHPLRIFATPDIPEGLSERDTLLARMKANEKNEVIGFHVDGRLCFIERLADYDERSASLRSGTQRRITAVLVGELGNQPVSTLREFRSWFPMELLSALSFVSGVEVGLPWIEIRADDGELIRRLHGNPSLPVFHEGDALLRMFDAKPGEKSGTGEFLTAYACLPEDKRSYLQAVMDHGRLGSLGSHLRLHDILDQLVRAFECLCREHKLARQELLPMLSSPTQDRVREIISDATSRLRALRAERVAASDLGEATVLTRIEGRSANAGATENSFGLAVNLLLKKLILPDAAVVDKFIAANPRPDGLPDWAAVLNMYRGATIHEGYLDFDRKHDAGDVIRVCSHLKDVLARIVLKEIGYVGTYEPVVRQFWGPTSIDWVQSDTDAARLGF